MTSLLKENRHILGWFFCSWWPWPHPLKIFYSRLILLILMTSTLPLKDFSLAKMPKLKNIFKFVYFSFLNATVILLNKVIKVYTLKYFIYINNLYSFLWFKRAFTEICKRPWLVIFCRIIKFSPYGGKLLGYKDNIIENKDKSSLLESKSSIDMVRRF